MEHFFHGQQPGRKALRVMMTQEGLQWLAIWRNTVGPEVIAHECARFLQTLFDKRERNLGRRGVRELLKRDCFRTFESLEHRAGQPAMLLDELPPHADKVHNRKNSRALEIVLRRRDRIGEQPADLRVTAETRRYTRSDKTIDFARLQHAR